MTKEEKAQKAHTDALIDGLLAKTGLSHKAVLGEGGLVAQLTKRVVERALAGELTYHLGYEAGEKPQEVGNHRVRLGLVPEQQPANEGVSACPAGGPLG